MKTVGLKQEHGAYLERTARKLSELSGRRVSSKEVLHTLVDIAIRDEGVYDPKSHEPLDAYAREFRQSEKEARTASFDVPKLFEALRAI